MRSPMHQQIDTLPQLVREIAKPFDESARATFDFELCTSVKRIYLVGCGDSYHGAFLFGLLQGMGLQQTASFASGVAALNSQALGGRAGLPTLQRVMTFLSRV